MTTKRPGISADKICQATIKLAATERLENLSMRKLAKLLGIEAASLYNHIPNKAALLDLVQAHMLKQLAPVKTLHPWQAYLREFAHNLHDLLLRYPNLAPLFATRPSRSDYLFRQMDAAFCILLAAGFTEAEALFTFLSIGSFVIGQALAEIDPAPTGPTDQIIPMSNMNWEHYPHLQKVFSVQDSRDYQGWFKFGIDTLIQGLEKQLQGRQA